MNATINVGICEFTISDNDIVNIDDVLYEDDRWKRPDSGLWVFHDHGSVLCAVFADNLQEALDAAADSGKLDRYLITDADAADYPSLNTDDEDGITRLGNAGEPFDIETLSVFCLGPVRRSIVAQIAANQPGVKFSHFA